MTTSRSFDDAANAFIDTVSRIPDGRWDDAGLGVWTVRELVGHTSRAITTIDAYLTADNSTANVAVRTVPARPNSVTAEDYYARVFGGSDDLGPLADHAAIAQRGVEASEQLGDDPVATLRAQLERTVANLRDQGADRIVTIGSIRIPLEEYLDTRIFELVVHTLDIAKAVGITADIPPSLVANTVALAARIASERGFGVEVLLALTGREPLREGFTIL